MKATSGKGYTGANQSRMAVSKTVLIPPELKTADKTNLSIKTMQVIFLEF